MCDLRQSWMQSKWTDLQCDAASQQMEQVQQDQEQWFADDQPEVVGNTIYMQGLSCLQLLLSVLGEQMSDT